MTVNYPRKLYAFLRNDHFTYWGNDILPELVCLKPYLKELGVWWSSHGKRLCDIASSSDRLNFISKTSDAPIARHPISGQVHPLKNSSSDPDLSEVRTWTDSEQVYWWFWRFYPELRVPQNQDALLEPAHLILPDCPLHSYQTTVSALTSACFNEAGEPTQPYLLLFSFSPIQEFIKASRKFLDFWAGSYLLHYLSAKLCWTIAQEYGPDAIITPSLWSQEIIDAFQAKKYDSFNQWFQKISPDGLNAVERWEAGQSDSLSTAGFPNMIVVLVSGKQEAQHCGDLLSTELVKEWKVIADRVKQDIRERVSQYCDRKLKSFELFKNEISELFPDVKTDPLLYESDLRQWLGVPKANDPSSLLYANWQWNELWKAQIEQTWEPYWTALPLGSLGDCTEIEKMDSSGWDREWINAQRRNSQSQTVRTIGGEDVAFDIPTALEEQLYSKLNIGTWWGSLQQRLRVALIAVKTTRNWQIPIAPGSRSSISGQFSAVHPSFNYKKFADGGGLSEGKMRFFWWVMAQSYPGVFDGSEQLNALELTKRMAWTYGGVAYDLGIPKRDDIDIDYDRLIRFPNLTSIAAARFAADHPERVTTYWELLKKQVLRGLAESKILENFYKRTKRPFQIQGSDAALKTQPNYETGFNGVMFSSKWLAEDMNLPSLEKHMLRTIIDKTHQDCNFGDGSPGDWWVILLADGDGMGGYVSGQKLKVYESYLDPSAIGDPMLWSNPDFIEFRTKTHKRMGPATHVGLNRALLDFSNRLVPYLTEKRFCGKLVYSGGDDVMALLPLEDLPEYIISLRSAWCGGIDPKGEFQCDRGSEQLTGYWHPNVELQARGFPNRPLFTMGTGATLSAGMVIAHKSVPLPTVLESLWKAEKDGAKKLPGKDGLCFRVIYSNGNQLTALMPGILLTKWWECISAFSIYQDKLSPVLYRLSEELPGRISVPSDLGLVKKAAEVIMARRDDGQSMSVYFKQLASWLADWEIWALSKRLDDQESLGTTIKDLGNLLRFTAFWVDKRVERETWVSTNEETKS